MGTERQPPLSANTTRARRALQSLNFLIVDMQAGLGPFALALLALWIGFAGTLRPACAGAGNERQAKLA